MPYKRPLLLLLLLAMHVLCHAQTVKHINSTEMDWAGGIAGHYGERYTFSLEFSGFSKDPVPVSIWIGNDNFPITFRSANDNGNTTLRRSKNGKTITITIAANVNHDDYADHFPNPEGVTKGQPKQQPPIKYKGKALLVYEYLGKEQYFVIAKIRQMLPRADYP